MNIDQIKGKLQDAIGHVKQGTGEAVGDDKLANEGLADQVKGSARETWGNVKDAASTGSDAAADRSTNTAADTRSTLSEKLHDAKNAINDRIDEFKANHDR